MITEAGRNWILRAKTGWEGRFGWWIGWVEWPTGPVFFALNIDTPNRTDDLFKRGNRAGNPSLYRRVAAQLINPADAFGAADFDVRRQRKLNGNPIPHHTAIYFFLTSFVHAQEHVVVRSDWKKFFSDLQAEGAIVIADERQAEHALLVFGQERAAKRYSPASTFKLPHTLFALDAGAVRDEFQVFRWDGVKRGFAGHNQDQDLRSAMRNSAVWVYELFAKEIGEDNARRYLKQIDYGNADLRQLRAITG